MCVIIETERNILDEQSVLRTVACIICMYNYTNASMYCAMLANIHVYRERACLF